MSLPRTTREYRLPKADGFHNFTVREAPIPHLKNNEVLLKVHAVSLQYRDLIVAKGQYPFGQKENVVPGSDMAGEIVAVAEGVAGWQVGERVMPNFSLEHIFGEASEETGRATLGAPIDGVLIEYKIVPAHVRPCAHPWIATSSSDKKLEIAKKLGAKHLINYKKTPDWEDEVLKITKGRGVDHVIEVGGPGTITRSLKAARFGSNVALIGFVAGAGDATVSSVPILVHHKAINMRGIHIGSRTQFEDMNRLIEGVNLKPVIDKVFDFEHLRDAYAYLESQQHVGKIVVKVAKH